MPMDPLGDVSNEVALDAFGTAFAGMNIDKAWSLTTLRDPSRCRKERKLDQQRIKFHQSVKDRMEGIEGWVPLYRCCKEITTSVKQSGLKYVTNPSYEERSGKKAKP